MNEWIHLLKRISGCNLTVECQPSKLNTWVQFPSPAPVAESLSDELSVVQTLREIENGQLKICDSYISRLASTHRGIAKR